VETSPQRHRATEKRRRKGDEGDEKGILEMEFRKGKAGRSPLSASFLSAFISPIP
jgi:hypothetical protein